MAFLNKSTVIFGVCIALFTLYAPLNAYAGPSEASVQHAKRVAKACPKAWKTQRCLKAVSESNLAMAANYGATLKEQGKTAAVETLKEHCSASTAAANGKYSSRTMRSAYVECANIIVDVGESTGVPVDASHYQLLVGAVLCLDKDPTCMFIEQGLKKYR